MNAQEYLKRKGIEFKVIHLGEIPKSAQDVERLYGCPLHQVLKTLVFVSESKSIVAVVPGDKKVAITKLKNLTKMNNLRMARPDEVLSISGYSVGGVTPFGIDYDVIKVIDSSIFDIRMVNIGSGKAEIGIELSSRELKKAWDGIVADISE